MPRANPETISPTAHYTSTIWLQNGLSTPAFSTLRGLGLYYALKGPMALSHRLGGPTIEDFLLARHRLIDLQLTQAIEDGLVSQIIEVGAGLSPRGWRFAERYKRRIHYIEADLPDMAQTKRQMLADGGLDEEGHDVVNINALADDGPESLLALAATLDPTKGTAIITEGLINYFDTASVEAMWARFARVLKHFPVGLYLSDLHQHSHHQGLLTDAFKQGLSLFVRGSVHMHYNDSAEAAHALLAAGFDSAEVLQTGDFGDRIPDCQRPGAKLVSVLVAHTGSGA